MDAAGSEYVACSLHIHYEHTSHTAESAGAAAIEAAAASSNDISDQQRANSSIHRRGTKSLEQVSVLCAHKFCH